MTRYEIEQKIDKLHEELEIAQGCDEDTACRIYGCDSKAEYVGLIRNEIDTYETLLEEFQEPTRNYERTADIPHLCW